jgi:hypothetical protein
VSDDYTSKDAEADRVMGVVSGERSLDLDALETLLADAAPKLYPQVKIAFKRVRKAEADVETMKLVAHLGDQTATDLLAVKARLQKLKRGLELGLAHVRCVEAALPSPRSGEPYGIAAARTAIREAHAALADLEEK